MVQLELPVLLVELAEPLVVPEVRDELLAHERCVGGLRLTVLVDVGARHGLPRQRLATAETRRRLALGSGR